MCGITGVYANKWSLDVVKNLYNIFIDQKERGINGAGLSVNTKKSLWRFRSISPFRIFNVYNIKLWQDIADGDRLLFHHRWPTSTRNKPDCNHPIANEKRNIHIIHNGVIINHRELKKQLKGHEFETLQPDGNYTDSEVIVHIIEDGLKRFNDIGKALGYMYDKVSGSFAVAVSIKDDDNIYLVRHSYPIEVSMDSQQNYYFSSEFKKNKQLTHITTLKEGEIGKISRDGYTRLIQKEVKETDWAVRQRTDFNWNESNWKQTNIGWKKIWRY